MSPLKRPVIARCSQVFCSSVLSTRSVVKILLSGKIKKEFRKQALISRNQEYRTREVPSYTLA